ncbi:MAG TPA: DUF1631 family protein, partial [Aquabacterium sp.]|nr:DUF1631 family protein [Aquabacterium sp.]
MADNPYYRKHIQDTLDRCPALVTQWVDKTMATLRSSSTDITLAHDRNLVFQVQETLLTQRRKLEDRMLFHIQAEVEAANSPAISPTRIDQVRLDQLTLVDESEAEREIEISRTVQLIDLHAEWELREMQAFAATLRGETRPRADADVFRPAVFAKALSLATSDIDLAPGARNLLLRVGARILAELLKQFYADTCSRLKAQGLSPLAYQAVTQPKQPRASDVNVTQPGALQHLLNRIPARQLMDQGMPASMVSASIDHAMQGLQQRVAEQPAVDVQALALLSRLFEQMIKDQSLQPEVKRVIDRLQPSVLKVAMKDPWLIRSHQHPTWRLINEVASHANGYATDNQHVSLSAFMRFLEPVVHQLAEHPKPQAAQYEHALQQVQTFVEQQSQKELQPTQRAVAELEVADQRQALRPLLKQQIAHQLAATKVSDRIKDFLSGAWVDVLAHTMATQGEDSQETLEMLATVDDLLQSLQRPASEAERTSLRQMLPGLIERLQRGMAVINLPQGQRDAILDDLMIIHTRHLRRAPQAPKEPTPEELVRQMQKEMEPDEEQPFEHALRRQVLDTNIGSLPTVPLSFGDDAQN